jgi:hypothetical protein
MAWDSATMTTTEIRETLHRIERREQERRSHNRHTNERRHLERMLAEVLEPQTVPELATILRSPAQVPEADQDAGTCIGGHWHGTYGDSWGEAR